MANATTLRDRQGNKLYPRTKASLSLMENGVSVEAEINNLKEKTRYNKGHFSTPEALNSAYPSVNPDGTIISDEDSILREGWYAIVGSTDTVWIWDVQGKEWVNSGTGASPVDSVNGETGEVILTGENINATATIEDTSVTKKITGHLNDIYNELEDTVKLDGDQIISGTKTFTNVIGLLNEDVGQVDQIKHINNNFLITSGTGQNLLNIDEGLETVSVFNRQLAFEDEIEEIQGHYVSYDEQTGKTEAQKAQARANIGAGTSDIDTVKVNGVAQPIENGSVNITLPSTTDALPILEGADVWELDAGWYVFDKTVKINNNTYTIYSTDDYPQTSQLLMYVSTTVSSTYDYRTIILHNSQQPTYENGQYSIFTGIMRTTKGTIQKSSNGVYSEIWENYPYRQLGDVVTDVYVENDTVKIEKDGVANSLNDIATKTFVEENGGKIDAISVNGVEQTIVDKKVNVDVPLTFEEGVTVEPEINELLEKIYPIGSIYISTNGISPAEFLGGTWLPVEDRFLLGKGSSYTLGDKDGEATHTLTQDEIPSHRHLGLYWSSDNTRFGGSWGSGSNSGYKLTGSSATNLAGNEFRTGTQGGGQAHNNMPPYQVVAMYERVG